MYENDIRVTTWNELNDQVMAGAWRPDLARFRSTFVFRGAGSTTDDLSNSLVRGGYAAQEQHLLRNFRKYAMQIESSPGTSIWNWLAVAQHHGLPTRLLDWSYSPYVALHFATISKAPPEEDSAIWCIDVTATNRLLPAPLRRVLGAEGSYVFTAELLSRIADSLAAFDRLSRRDFVAFFEPPSLDERIVNQFALFSLMSSPTTSLDNWLREHPETYRRIVIPAELKGEIRDRLDQINITERVLFPGLDGLSAWLKRYYTPKPRIESKVPRRRPR